MCAQTTECSVNIKIQLWSHHLAALKCLYNFLCCNFVLFINIHRYCCFSWSYFSEAAQSVG